MRANVSHAGTAIIFKRGDVSVVYNASMLQYSSRILRQCDKHREINDSLGLDLDICDFTYISESWRDTQFYLLDNVAQKHLTRCRLKGCGKALFVGRYAGLLTFRLGISHLKVVCRLVGALRDSIRRPLLSEEIEVLHRLLRIAEEGCRQHCREVVNF